MNGLVTAGNQIDLEAFISKDSSSKNCAVTYLGNTATFNNSGSYTIKLYTRFTIGGVGPFDVEPSVSSGSATIESYNTRTGYEFGFWIVLPVGISTILFTFSIPTNGSWYFYI